MALYDRFTPINPYAGMVTAKNMQDFYARDVSLCAQVIKAGLARSHEDTLFSKRAFANALSLIANGES